MWMGEVVESCANVQTHIAEPLWLELSLSVSFGVLATKISLIRMLYRQKICVSAFAVCDERHLFLWTKLMTLDTKAVKIFHFLIPLLALDNNDDLFTVDREMLRLLIY